MSNSVGSQSIGIFDISLSSRCPLWPLRRLAFFEVSEVGDIEFEHLYACQDSGCVFGQGREIIRIAFQVLCRLFQLSDLLVYLV